MMLHYDYERDKDKYHEAHLQISADPAEWSAICENRGLGKRPFAKLHLSVGGRRFRPTLEDLISFLVAERLVTARPNWDTAVKAGQKRFEEKQLRAAIRRNPEVAKDAVAKLATS
jgi:hypothetical protein